MMADASTQARFRVDGMDCAGCASKINTAVRRMPGVAEATVSVTAGTMTVHHDATSDLVAIQKPVTGLGYTIEPLRGAASDKQSGASHAHDDNEQAERLHGHD